VPRVSSLPRPRPTSGSRWRQQHRRLALSRLADRDAGARDGSPRPRWSSSSGRGRRRACRSAEFGISTPATRPPSQR
jgi:hypothetical protein